MVHCVMLINLHSIGRSCVGHTHYTFEKDLTSSDYSSNTNTRGHAYKLYISQNSCSTRRKFLSCRILAVWNSLPANTDFSSLAAFKRTV